MVREVVDVQTRRRVGLPHAAGQYRQVIGARCRGAVATEAEDAQVWLWEQPGPLTS